MLFHGKPNKSTDLSVWMWILYYLFLWQVLLWAQNPGLMSDDSGEMAAAAYNLGLPHPPGYPFFDLIGHLVTWLPLGSIAFRLNLFSSLLALLSLFFTFSTIRRLNGKDESFQSRSGRIWFEILLMVLGLAFFSFRAVFAQSLTAKGCIYTMNLFLTSAVVWLYLRHLQHPQDRRSLLAGWLLWSVGLANHWQTVVLWVPFLLVWTFQSRGFRKAKTLLLTASLVLVGFSLYLYLPLRAQLDCEPCWGYPINLQLFYWVVSRQLVAGVEHWVQDASFYLESAEEMGRALFLDWIPGFCVLSLGGLIVLWRQNEKIFWGIVALGTPVFFGIFAVHESYNTYLLPVYLVSLAGLLVLLGFVAVKWFLENLAVPKAAPLLIGIFGLLSAEQLLGIFQLEGKSRYVLAEDFGTNAMMGLPRGAILLADGDHYVMPIWYSHFAEGKRPDLVFEPSVFLYHGWGWKQLGDQSADLKQLVTASNLFQDRLDILTRALPRHALLRSLGQEFLGPALVKMPGTWVPKGLVYAWEPRKPSERVLLSQALRVIGEERLRGLGAEGIGSEMDPSSRQIYRYYADQLSVLKQ